MTAHDHRTVPSADPCPLPGTPSPGDVLRALLTALPHTDPEGFISALAHAYDTSATTEGEHQWLTTPPVP